MLLEKARVLEDSASLGHLKNEKRLVPALSYLGRGEGVPGIQEYLEGAGHRSKATSRSDC